MTDETRTRHDAPTDTSGPVPLTAYGTDHEYPPSTSTDFPGPTLRFRSGFAGFEINDTPVDHALYRVIHDHVSCAWATVAAGTYAAGYEKGYATGRETRSVDALVTSRASTPNFDRDPRPMVERITRWRWDAYVQVGLVTYRRRRVLGQARAERTARRLLARYLRDHAFTKERYEVTQP